MLSNLYINPIQDGPFRGGSRIGGGWQKDPLLKSVTKSDNNETCYSYTLPKEYPEYMNHVTHPLSSVDISIFSPEIRKFCYIKKYRHRLHIDT